MPPARTLKRLIVHGVAVANVGHLHGDIRNPHAPLLRGSRALLAVVSEARARVAMLQEGAAVGLHMSPR